MTATIAYNSDFAGRREDVDAYVMSVADRNTKILSMFLDLANPVKAMKHEWVDKTLVGFKDTLNAVLSSTTTTTITVNSGTNNPKRYIANCTLLEIDDEVMLVASVISVVTNTTQLNVTRAQQSTTAATHAANSQVLIVGNPKDEGFSAGRNDSQAGSRQYNMTQLFYREAKLSGSSQAIEVVDNEAALSKQMADLFPEILKEMQQALIRGRRNDGGSDYTTRRVGGFKYWVSTLTSANNISAGGGAINFGRIDDIIEAFQDNGGDTSQMTMLCSYRQQRKINDLKEARVVSGGAQQSDMSVNNIVTRYDFADKAQVDIICTNDLANDEVYIFQKDKVKVKPLQTRQLKTQPLPQDGDFVREMILGEYTFEFRNIRETLYRYYALAT